MIRWKPKQQTVPAVVPSPYGNGVDRVERVIEPIEAMHRKGQLDTRQVDAAERFRRAHEAMAGRLRCALDDAAGSGQQHGRSGYDAVSDILDAHYVLGILDYRIVLLVAYEGRTIREISAMGDVKATARDVDMLGRRLREGLGALADHWLPIRSKIRGELYAPKVAPGDAKAIVAGMVAHATSSRIYGFTPEGGQPMIRRRSR